MAEAAEAAGTGSTALILDSIEDQYYFVNVHKAKGEAVMEIANPLYVLTLDRSGGTRLGLKLDVQVAHRALFIKEVVGGLAFQHNSAGAGERVRPGDRILRVNKVENDAHAMLEECKKTQPLELELHRGSAVPVNPGLSVTVKKGFGNFVEGSEGKVTKVDDDGDALITMNGAGRQWICKQDFDKFIFEDSDRYYLKRFVDFKEFYTVLKQKIDKPDGGSPIKTMPEIPKDESFGFRRHLSALGMSSFMQDRREGLQKIVNSLLSQVVKIEDEPLLAEFFGSSPIPTLGAAKEEMLKEQLDLLILKHQPQGEQQ